MESRPDTAMATTNADRTRRCPYCNSAELRRSRTRNLERLLRLARIRPYRCEDCDARFYARDITPPLVGRETASKAA
jgi:DNA-directed RNA polymerase subunit RPC12/RpoP